MIIDRSIFAKRMLTKRIKGLSDKFVCFYNLNKDEPVDDMIRLQKILRVAPGLIIEKETDEPVLLCALKNTENSILKDFQMVVYQGDRSTGFIINPVSKTSKYINDLPNDWFSHYLEQIQAS